MKPEEFKREWEAGGDALITFPEAAVQAADIPPAAKAFLKEVGLPRDAAPFLAFGPQVRTWGLPDCLEIGGNGSGDPIALMSDGAICYLNHDDGFARCYINKDLGTFAETLLRFRTLIFETQSLVGSDGYLDGRVPPRMRVEFIAFLSTTDPRALKPGAMWADEIANWG